MGTGSGSSSSFDPDPLVSAAESFEGGLRRGERPDPEAFADRYPELADRLREILPALVDLEPFGPGAGPGVGVEGGVPRWVGEYRIVREVGRGGMGVVFEAEQERLGRRVALKVLPGHALTAETRRERFEIEVRSAARLHHSNIVPVFGSGEHEGIPYIAMQFIEGRSLGDLLRAARDRADGGDGAAEDGPGGVIGGDAPGDFRAVARIGLQVAEALDYAHGRGVVHRDIKPGNLLVDDRGTAWVLDFGLAKLDGLDGPSRSGDLVGTLRYMAPERFDGSSGPAADLYALGATLFELLTLRPPFNERTGAGLIDRIRRGDPPRPRELVPRIPGDLETIVLKAMAREPGDRYASAGAMAEDLRRFLADRPILARRSSAADRLLRWHRRNSAVAALLWALLAALTAGLAGVSALYLEADRQRRASEESLRDARSAVEDLLTEVAESRLLDAPGLEPLRRELLRTALDYSRKFAERRGDDPIVRAELASSLYRLGRITADLGDPGEALGLFRRSLEIRSDLASASPGDDRARIDLAWSRHKVGDLLLEVGRPDEGEAELRRAVALLEGASAASAPGARRDLALTLGCLGTLLGRSGRDAQALGPYREALAIYRGMADEDPSPRIAADLAAMRNNIGILLHRLGRFGEAERCFREAMAGLEGAGEIEGEGGATRPRDVLACSRINLGNLQLDTGRLGEAAKSFEDANAILEPLVRDHPEVAGFREHLARSYGQLARLLRAIGHPDDAREWSDRASALRRSASPGPALDAP